MALSASALRTTGLGVAGLALWLAIWQWSTTSGPLVGISGLPSATATLMESARLLVSPAFWSAVGATLSMTALGLGAAVAVGLGLGIAMGLSPVIEAALGPLAEFMRPVPPVVLLPLILLLLGPTSQLGIVLAAFTAVWPVLTQTLVGVKGVDPVALETARAMRLPWRLLQTKVILPSSLPFIATGVRIAGSSALMLAIGVGLLGGAPGLGRLILTAQQAGQGTVVFGIIIWSGVIGILISALLSALERLLTRGHRPSGIEL